MSAEERWADRMERAEEKRRGFDVEIKNTALIRQPTDEICQHFRCGRPPIQMWEVGQVESRGGINIPLCEAHSTEEIAFEIYDDLDNE